MSWIIGRTLQVELSISIGERVGGNFCRWDLGLEVPRQRRDSCGMPFWLEGKITAFSFKS